MNIFPSFIIDKRRFYAKNQTHLFLIVPRNKGNGQRFRVNRNFVQILLLSLCLGITLGISLIPIFELQFYCDGSSNWFNQFEENIPVIKSVDPQSYPFNDDGSRNSNESVKHNKKNLLRPRFYTTELGLCKKLVAGIIVTDYSNQEKLIALNQTLSEHVNQLFFFVMGIDAAQKVKSLGITGVVTLTSRRNESIESHPLNPNLNVEQSNLVGLRGIKYLGEKFSNNYDYFFLSLDTFYINGKLLSDSLKKISVSQDVFWGYPDSTSGTCNLENGIVLSRSVIKKLSGRLDRCLFSVTLNKGSNSLNKCFQYSLGSYECSRSVQGHLYLSKTLKEDEDGTAVSTGPISSAAEMYGLHLSNLHREEKANNEKVTSLSSLIDGITPRLPENYQNKIWPTGLPQPIQPHSRFDVLKWKFFSQTHIYPENEYNIKKELTGIEKLDISSVINDSVLHLAQHHNQNADSFLFQFGYRRLDETRGMEYILNFQDHDEQVHRVECLRPLSLVEMIPMPFVMETRRVTIVIPITLDSYDETNLFLTNFVVSSSNRNLNCVLVLAIIISDSSLSSEDADKFQRLKRMIVDHSSNQKQISVNETADVMRIGHVVVNLKQFKAPHYILSVFDMLANRILNSNALILVFDIFVELQEEFLNRVRMNTILNFQAFSPIPFVEYDPAISGHLFDSNKTLQIHKSTGYFESKSFNFISFFIGDYISARKKITPPVKSFSSTLSKSQNGAEILSHLFLKGSHLHFLRAPEPTLNVRFNKNIYLNCSLENPTCLGRKWGSKIQLAKLIFSFSSTTSQSNDTSS